MEEWGLKKEIGAIKCKQEVIKNNETVDHKKEIRAKNVNSK